ncbi:helix-turn-helix domain-containing protein [Flagellimonas olearia]|uniref:Helix-turn-helix domain-containing protein n=1 Tax=Flagellimonas olearia TaxID=552546 RepID=A0A6I1E189_9FLAO|nr:AraC family transcriptional regulator [Allomuricauda olearia]KAB7530362.1 helix-turn-helix domain-containing protein [Allomuricauda olearia]
MDFQTQFISALKAYCTLRNIALDESFFARPMDVHDEPTIGELDVFWKEIMHCSGDDLLGLHFGESMQLAALGIVGQIITTSKTVGEALGKGASMVPLIAEGFEVSSEVIDGKVKIGIQASEEISLQYPYYHKAMGDFLGALIIHELDGLIVDKMTPSQISGSFTSDTLNEYCRVFRCQDYRHSKNMAISIDMNFLEIPIITSNYKMQQFLQTLLLKNHAVDLENGESLISRVGAYIMGNSYLRILSIDDVAANFNLSSRSLQRKLKEEGSSFKEIVDHVRKELALEYLKDRNNQVKDVAYSLGYNESSAFVRAFKRWTGTTPSMYLM